MYSKFYLLVLFVLALNVPMVAYSQCADIYEKGVALMENGKYTDAINLFKAAKQCDNSLAKQCDAKIRECRKRVPKSKTVAAPTVSYVITLDKETLKVESEDTGAKAVKVSSGAEWACTSDADWCIVTKKNEGSLSIQCKINKTPDERTAIIRVNNGKETKYIEVTQKGLDAVLNIVPDKMVFWKDGDDYEKIPLECTMDYQVVDQPVWIKIHEKDMENIVIKVEPLKGIGAPKYRDGYIKIKSSDGNEEDYVKIEQYKKLPEETSKDTDSEGTEQKKTGRKTWKNRKNK